MGRARFTGCVRRLLRVVEALTLWPSTLTDAIYKCATTRWPEGRQLDVTKVLISRLWNRRITQIIQVGPLLSQTPRNQKRKTGEATWRWCRRGLKSEMGILSLAVSMKPRPPARTCFCECLYKWGANPGWLSAGTWGSLAYTATAWPEGEPAPYPEPPVKSEVYRHHHGCHPVGAVSGTGPSLFRR